MQGFYFLSLLTEEHKLKILPVLDAQQSEIKTRTNAKCIFQVIALYASTGQWLNYWAHIKKSSNSNISNGDAFLISSENIQFLEKTAAESVSC